MPSSIRTQAIAAFLCIGVLPVAALGWTTLNEVGADERAHAQSEVHGLAHSAAGAVELDVRRAVDLLEAAGESEAMMDALTSRSSNPDKLNDTLHHTLNLSARLERILLVDPTGLVIALFPDGPETNLSGVGGLPLYLRETLARNAAYISPAYPGALGEGPQIALSAPVDALDGHLEFVLVGWISARGFSGVVESVRLPATARAMVIDQFGILLYHPDPRLVENMTNVSSFAIFQVPAAEEGFETDGVPAPGEPSVFSAALRVDQGWIVAVVVPSAEVENRVKSNTTTVVEFTAATALVAGVVAVFLGGTITGQLVRLSKLTRRIEEGGPIDLNVNGSKEVEQLAASVRSMATGLRKELENNRRLLDEVTAAQAAHDAANARLQELQDLVIRVMGHDLKGPLAVLQGYASVIESRLAGPLTPQELEALRRDLSRIRAAVSGMLVVIGNARAMSRLSMEGKGAPPLAETDLSRITEQTLDMLEPLAVAKEIKVRRRIAPGVKAHVLPGFDSVASNLFSNGVKYTPNGGVIDVDLSTQGDRIVLTVTDTGPGIPKELRERLFKKFERLSAESSAESHGLGLSIVATMATLAGGRASVEDRKDGVSGSVFRVEIPLKPSSDPTGPKA